MSRDKVQSFVDYVYDVCEDLRELAAALVRYRGYWTQKRVLAELPNEVVDEITPKTGLIYEWKTVPDPDTDRGWKTTYQRVIWRIWKVDHSRFTYPTNYNLGVDLPEYDVYTSLRGGFFKRRAIYEFAANIKPELNRVNMERHEKQLQLGEEHYTG